MMRRLSLADALRYTSLLRELRHIYVAAVLCTECEGTGLLNVEAQFSDSVYDAVIAHGQYGMSW